MKAMDSSAWFEYFFASSKGDKIRALIETGEELLTPCIVVGEIKRKLLGEGKEFEKLIEFISAKSKIIDVNKEIALRAAELKKLHFVDALIYASALENNSQLITCDSHFKGLDKVLFIE